MGESTGIEPRFGVFPVTLRDSEKATRTLLEALVEATVMVLTDACYPSWPNPFESAFFRFSLSLPSSYGLKNFSRAFSS